MKIGVQLHPQATLLQEMRQAWRAADAMGVDSIWTWDHFYPLYGDPDAPHFEWYGYEFGTAPECLRILRDGLPIIKERLSKLNPGPVNGKIPLMIGGSGEKVTLRLVAEHADMLNTFGPVDNFRHKNNVLNEWCEKVGRNPKDIERTVAIYPKDLDEADAFVEAGADHLIVMVGHPYDLSSIEKVLARR